MEQICQRKLAIQQRKAVLTPPPRSDAAAAQSKWRTMAHVTLIGAIELRRTISFP